MEEHGLKKQQPTEMEDGIEEEIKEDEIDLFSPINLIHMDKGRGGLRISGTHAGNSESGHSVSGSFSGSGQKPGSHGGGTHHAHHGTSGSMKRIKSLKSSHTIEKTYSDFFNLTQESGSVNNLDQLLISGSGSGSIGNVIGPLVNNLVGTMPPVQVSSQRTPQQQAQFQAMIEQKFGKLGGEIIEELYVSEVLGALDHCFQVVTNNLEQQVLMIELRRQHFGNQPSDETDDEDMFARQESGGTNGSKLLLVDTAELMHITGDSHSSHGNNNNNRYTYLDNNHLKHRLDMQDTV